MAARVAVGGGDGAGDVGAGGSRGKASGPLGEGSTSPPGEFMFRGCYIGIMENEMETTVVYWVNGNQRGNYCIILGLNGVVWGYMEEPPKW